MGCGLCKAKVPASAGALHIPKRVQQKNDLSPSSTWAASCSPAADTVIRGSDNNGTCSKVDVSTLSPSVSHEVARTPVEEKNKGDAVKHVKQNRNGGAGPGRDTETGNQKHSSSAGFEDEDAIQPCDSAISPAAVVEGNNCVHREKCWADGSSPKTKQSSLCASYAGEALCRQLSSAEGKDCSKRRCNDSFEESKRNEDASDSKRPCSRCTDAPADDTKCNSCEVFLLANNCQDYESSNVDTRTNAIPRKMSTTIREISNTGFDPLDNKADDSDSSKNIRIKGMSHVTKSRRDTPTASRECHEQRVDQDSYPTAALSCFDVAQTNSCLSQLHRVQQQEPGHLALCMTPENIKSLELSCGSNIWKEKFPSSTDIEQCIQAAYEACVHYKVDIAEEQLAKAEQLYARMHALCVGFTGKNGSPSSSSVNSSPYAPTTCTARMAPVVRGGLGRMSLPSHYDTKHLERKIENLRETIQTLRQALVFYSGSRSLHTASLRNIQQQLQLHPLHPQHHQQLQPQQQRLQKRQQLATLPAPEVATRGSVEDGNGRSEEQSGIWFPLPRAAICNGRNRGKAPL